MEATIATDTTQVIDLHRPDDFHLHLREGALLQAVLPATAKHFARALVMPNLTTPVKTVKDATAYRNRIQQLLPSDSDFQPLMTLYLTEETDPQSIKQAVSSGVVQAVKLYPKGATTNSSSGVRDIKQVRSVLDEMEAQQLPLCVHGEIIAPEIDVFDRESAFIDQVLLRIRKWNPGLRIVLEHITTEEAVDVVRDQFPFVAATITVHHLILNRSHIFEDGLHPHRFCFPVAKREKHRLKILQAATGGERCFFLGTDSAPHLEKHKLQPCGCAGIYSAPMALPCLAQIFEDQGLLGNLEMFTSKWGADFYRLPKNPQRCRLIKSAQPVPLPNGPSIGHDRVEVFDPGFPIYWRVN